MVNKPKIAGTAVETAFVNYLKETGFPYAERRSLQGALDKGDVTGCPGLVWECKLAHRGFLLASWLRETNEERFNANADYGILVCKPRGLGALSVGQWPAFMYMREFVLLQAYAAEHSIGTSAAFLDWQVIQVPNTIELMPNLRGLRHQVRYCPPGQKENIGGWYVGIQVRDMVELVRAAGYGEALEPE
jgi:hypothetical protein